MQRVSMVERPGGNRGGAETYLSRGEQVTYIDVGAAGLSVFFRRDIARND